MQRGKEPVAKGNAEGSRTGRKMKCREAKKRWQKEMQRGPRTGGKRKCRGTKYW